jgi:hypothetical protein
MKRSLTPEGRRLRALVRSRLWELLAVVADSDGTALAMTCRDDRHEARLTIGPAGSLAPPGQPLPPGYFSPIELLVVNAIGSGRALTLKQIVKDSGVKLTAELPTLIRHLKARGVLVHRQGKPGVCWSEEYQKLRGNHC